MTPHRTLWAGVALVALCYPWVWVWRNRQMTSPQPPVQWIQDMDRQARYRAQSPSGLFADGRAMRPRVPGALAQEDRPASEEAFQSVDGENRWVRRIPGLSGQMLEEGRESYGVFCLPCHGPLGEGDGMVAQAAKRLQVTSTSALGWVDPTALNLPRVVALSDGQILATITEGQRRMPAYGSQIPISQRWAIVAWVRVLQHLPPGEAGGR